MASSSYLTTFAVSFNPSVSLKPAIEEYFTKGGADGFEIIHYGRLHSYNDSNIDKNLKGVIIKDGSHHTCRETALGNIFSMNDSLLRKGSILNKTYNKAYGILYYLENGRTLEDSHIELIKKFISVYKQDNGLFSILGGNRVLFTNEGDSMEPVIFASLMFFLFRKRKLLEIFVDALEKQHATSMGYRLLLKTLIPFLIENSEICDPANPAIMLAYYCYRGYLGRDLIASVYEGPVYFVSNSLSAKTMVDFYNMFIKHLGEDVVQRLLGQAHLFSDFKENFSIIINLINQHKSKE